MKVFISWSGEQSGAVALALKTLLETTIQRTAPFVSHGGIDAGERWRTRVDAELDASEFGVACLTPSNLHSDWIMFEAGAISKSVSRSRFACVLSCGASHGDVPSPLAAFQNVRADEQGIRQLLASVNEALSEERLPDAVFDAAVEAHLPRFVETVAQIPLTVSSTTTGIRDAEIERLKSSIEKLRQETSEVIGLVSSSLDASLSSESFSRGLRAIAPSATQNSRTSLRDTALEDARQTFESRVLTIDVSAISDGELSVVYRPHHSTEFVSNLLDSIYIDISDYVEPFSYGSHWLLEDASTGQEYRDWGSEWAEKHGESRDFRTFQEIGIVSGQRLRAVRA